MRRLTPRRIARRLRRRGKRLAIKFRVLRRYGAFRRSPLAAVRYLLRDHEIDNFTYVVTNPADLADHLATVLDAPRDIAWERVNELLGDDVLDREVGAAISSRPDRNRRMPFGRRAGWYALVRLLRPSVVVETGVHDGLGSTALLRALDRNAEEGDAGVLVSFDINPAAGWIIPASLRPRHELIIGSSIDGMAGALHGRSIGLFIHDSEHRYEYERRELEMASSLGNPRTVFVSDNAHATTALQDFAADHGLRFSFWRERVAGHFYPGAGIGMAVPPAPVATVGGPLAEDRRPAETLAPGVVGR
jgi:hypothetical protein